MAKADAEYPEYYVKWENLPYSEATWEEGSLLARKSLEAIEDFNRRKESKMLPSKSCRVLSRRPKFHQIMDQPEWIGSTEEYKLRDYQMEGLNWLTHAWCK